MKRLYKSNTDKVISGVCGGIAKYFNIDPTLVRVVWVISFLIGGIGFFGYIVAMIIIPKEPVNLDKKDFSDNFFESDQKSFPYNIDSNFLNIDKEKVKNNLPIILGSILIGFGVLVLASSLGFFKIRVFGKFIIPAIVIGLGLYFVVNNKGK